MGNYPYPSAYMLNGNGRLPAYPMRVACDQISGTLDKPEELLEDLAGAVGVFYNYSHDLPCFNFSSGPNKETDEVNDLWLCQSCTEMVMPFSRDGGEAHVILQVELLRPFLCVAALPFATTSVLHLYLGGFLPKPQQPSSAHMGFMQHGHMQQHGVGACAQAFPVIQSVRYQSDKSLVRQTCF